MEEGGTDGEVAGDRQGGRILSTREIAAPIFKAPAWVRYGGEGDNLTESVRAFIRLPCDSATARNAAITRELVSKV